MNTLSDTRTLLDVRSADVPSPDVHLADVRTPDVLIADVRPRGAARPLRRVASALGALVVAVFVVGPALFLGAGVASAHSALVGSDPASGAELATGPETVTLTFNEPLQPQFAALTVTGPDRNQWSDGDPTVDGSAISVRVAPLGPAGEYTIAYRVTSADGHPISGTSTFTLTQAGSGTAPGAGAADGTTAPAADDAASGSDSGGPAVWWFVVAAVVVVAAGAWFVLRRRP